ncbi:hypothetical protein CQA53_08860 [Helicobacter didelphidarum]|uniref:Uncharacterized protein n=1 Tax=Helicobacter didelphidarum TaxID=2040648 RepID=A0A3D8ICV9_9HELI|nr:hypothetical protein [Helicobacter didelphidarum]RDU62920.1 hypothetical protein CQA53_08860 [Helicobacter didelphidarum]
MSKKSKMIWGGVVGFIIAVAILGNRVDNNNDSEILEKLNVEATELMTLQKQHLELFSKGKGDSKEAKALENKIQPKMNEVCKLRSQLSNDSAIDDDMVKAYLASICKKYESENAPKKEVKKSKLKELLDDF